MSAVFRPTFYVVLFCIVHREFLTFNFFSVRLVFIRVVSVVVSGLNYELRIPISLWRLPLNVQ